MLSWDDLLPGAMYYVFNTSNPRFDGSVVTKSIGKDNVIVINNLHQVKDGGCENLTVTFASSDAYYNEVKDLELVLKNKAQ